MAQTSGTNLAQLPAKQTTPTSGKSSSAGILPDTSGTSIVVPELPPNTAAMTTPPDAAAAPSFRLVYVDPTAGWGGDGSLARPFNSWYAFALQAGDIALQRGGTVASGFTISVHGTASQSVIIGSYGTGQAHIVGTVVLSGATQVTVTGLDITGGNACGVVFTDNAASCVVQDCDIHGGMTGVLFDGGTTNSNTVSNNLIHDNDTVGVWFNGSSASAGAETLVSGNTIYRNGEQGILLQTSHVIVDQNSVVNNGLSGLPGVSAIHVIGMSANDMSGHNVISNNVVADQRDGSSFDGNGILLDTWSDGNSVVGNTVSGNDGAGISLLSAGGNLVMNNILRGNVVDSGGTHVISKSEIFLGEAEYASGRTTGNVITGNVVLATTGYATAVQVQAAVTADRSNVITGNDFNRQGAGPLWTWGTQSGSAISGWNVLARAGTDTTTAIPPPALPAFDASIMDRTFTLHSNVFLLPNPNGISILVPDAVTKGVAGGPLGNWIAGDGRDNILIAGGGDNLISAGSGNAALFGKTGNDSFFGGAGDNMMFAGSGNTMMVGGSGNSRMVGGAGNDLIMAGNRSGTDTLDGGAGTNSLVGGAGIDTFVLGSGVDYISQFTLGQDRLDVSDFGVSSMADLQLFGDAAGGLISDKGGVIHGVLEGVDVRLLAAKDFVFAKIG